MPITTNASTPFGLQSGGSVGGPTNAGGSDILPAMDNVLGQTQQQTAQFSGLLQDPSFTGQSEMGAMLKLQRAVSLETMMFQTVSNLEKSFTDSKKNAIANMK
jgi:hypothetical protein